MSDVIAVTQKTATDSFDSCESIGYIKGNAVVLFVFREYFIIISMKMFPTAGGLQHE